MSLCGSRPSAQQGVNAPSQRPRRPMEAVIGAIGGGARSRAEIRDATGLSSSTVDAVIKHLERIGRLTLEELGANCSGGSCGSCVAAQANGGVGCPSGGRAKGPVALTLTTKPEACRAP